jgi:hypothetical protein
MVLNEIIFRNKRVDRHIEAAIGDEVFEELGTNIGTDIVPAGVELCRQDVGNIDDFEREPRRTRTSNRLIKRLLIEKLACAC